MKKMIVIMLLVISSAAFAGTGSWDHWLIGTLGLSEQHEFSISGGGTTEYDIEGVGLNIGYEGLYGVTDNISIGVGFDFMMPRTLDDSAFDAQFNMSPVYFSFMAHANASPINGYFSAGLGLVMLYAGNDDYHGGGDLYGSGYAHIGGGIIYDQKFRFELRSCAYLGVIDWLVDVDAAHTMLGFMFGYRF